MKRIKYILALLLFAGALTEVAAQTRKYVSQFSHFQSYFNPALSGYEGSILRGLVRNQWAGFEGAPKTYFFSAELDFAEMGGERDPALTGKNALSLNLLNDTYGAFRENELTVAYASRVRLTNSHNLRLGVGVSYQSVRLDGNALTSEQASDPTIGQYIGTFSDMQVIDFNIGLALTHEQYYVSYGVHRVNGGAIQKGDEFMDGYPAEQMIQAGFREAVTPDFSIIANGFFRSRKDLPNVTELNLKALLMDKVWIGAGHRFEYANNIQFGLLTKRLRIGYVYEFPLSGTYLMRNSTHEFTAILSLFRDNQKSHSREVLMW
jgi:type IX secretion system PorP/SprF family membrane protein